MLPFLFLWFAMMCDSEHYDQDWNSLYAAHLILPKICGWLLKYHNNAQRRKKEGENVFFFFFSLLLFFFFNLCQAFYFQKILVSSGDAVLLIAYFSFIFSTMWLALRRHLHKQNGRDKKRLVMQEQLLVFSSITWEFFTFSFSASPQMFSLLCASWVFTVQDYGGGGNILPIVQWRQWLRSQSLEGHWCLANVSTLLLLHVPYSRLQEFKVSPPR